MEHRRKYVFLLLLPFLNLSLYGQDKDAEIESIIEERIEFIAGQNNAETVEFIDLSEDLYQYYKHPLNLNTATKNDLRQLFILNELQISNLVMHIQKHGKLINIYELQTIENFDEESIRMLLPFVKVGSSEEKPFTDIKELFNNADNDLFLRYNRQLERPAGWEDNPQYNGSWDKFYTRYRFSYSTNISAGFTAEKDPGEAFFSGSNPHGFDFYSAHFFLKDIGRLKRMAVGDYQVQFGQGLSFWSGFGFGKNTDAMGIKKVPQVIRPYTSLDENRFLRGIAATYAVGNIHITGFCSSKKIDGNLINTNDTLLMIEQKQVSSFQSSGFHRTAAEIEDEDAVGEKIYGGNVSFQKDRFDVGATAVFSQYDADLLKSDQLYNQYDFRGSKTYNTGIDYSYSVKNFNLFGEVSRSANGGLAFLHGALISLDPKASLAVLHRKYDRHYQAAYSEGFSENSTTSNESGIYFGSEFQPTRKLSITSYFDYFRFPWLKYRVNRPSAGNEFFSQINYRVSRKTEFYIRYKQEIKEENTDDEMKKLPDAVERKKQNLRFHASYSILASVEFRNRVELTHYSKEKEQENGYLIFHDVVYKKMESPLSLTMRYALFDTDTYNSRIYAYENNVLYAFSIPAYFNKGSRFYILIRYKAVRNFDIWLRFGRTFYNNVDETGSGLDKINGNTRTSVTAQVRIRF